MKDHFCERGTRLLLPFLLLMSCLCFKFCLTDQSAMPPTVRFQYLKGIYSKVKEDKDKVRADINKLTVPIIGSTIFDTLRDRVPRESQMEDDNIRSALLREFRHDTIRSMKKIMPNSTCGVELHGTKVKFVHCPGSLIIVTLEFIDKLSCRAIEKMDLFGPIIFKNEICHQMLLVKSDCKTAYTLGYLRSECNLEIIQKASTVEIIILTSVSLVLLLSIVSLIVFIVKLQRVRKVHNLTTSRDGIELTTYLTLDDNGMQWVNVKEDPERPNTKRIMIRMSLTRLILSMLCFFPLKVSTYDLINSQSLAGNKYKYDITLGDSEKIPIGATYIGMSDHSAVSRLSFEFRTYPWKIEIKNDYGCLQSKCNDLTVCREDMLPFMKANNKVRDFLKIQDNRTVYATCKNMLGYCTFANGCFIIGAILNFEENSPYSVYKVGRQHLSEDSLNLPPGCYLDYLKMDETSNLVGLFYVENGKGDSWFCKSDLYSHHPLPHSLGDLKLDKLGEINFITNHINCATDHWRDVYCYMPDSFIQDIDSYCVKNTKGNLGYNVVRSGDVLNWEGRDLLNLKITCDRDLKLVHFKDHCYDTVVDVWDTQNELDDLLLTVTSKSTSGSGLFTFPRSVHMEIHSFPCNSQPYTTMLFDLLSLNSSGIPYNFHLNKKNLVPDNESGESVAPEGNNGGYDFSIGSIWTWVARIFSGFSGITIVAAVLILVLII